ncbi:hypothetical protein SUGI_0782200 [Cryptomeria japonica]|uniref:wound-induced protein 1 n=1 Tax=Cryptomeria japonica TaxID=3369 RepID=UPI002414B3E5|nr:wound-induced protein 1 [Cryptomeria japonica]GLJ38414.1 hypothetical protein SUGI_0782200 [Cryptomeria japonica]
MYTHRCSFTNTFFWFHFSWRDSNPGHLKLANSRSEWLHLEEAKEKNRVLVSQLYDALQLGKAKTVRRILAPDLEWWFHGPPHCQHLMRFLTGRSHHKRLFFGPQSITPVADKVFVEGREDESLYWVHVWTVENGIVTQLREYFNTSLIVTEFKRNLCFPVWQSDLPLSDEEAMPGLVLAI